MRSYLRSVQQFWVEFWGELRSSSSSERIVAWSFVVWVVVMVVEVWLS